MMNLEHFKSAGGRYSLDELVAIANRLLPCILPAEIVNSKLREEVNPRLVRQLSTLGLLDEALREGREARYLYRHLLQLLVARRLMAQGYTTSAVKNLTGGAADDELESLLLGRGQLTFSPQAAQRIVADERDQIFSKDRSRRFVSESLPAAEAGTALDYLEKIRAKAGSAAPDISALTSEPLARYVRVEVRAGLELHLSEDFQLPPSPQERDTLLEEIMRELKKANKNAGVRRRRT